MRTVLGLLALALLSCKVPSDPTGAGCGVGPLLVRGTVVRVTGRELLRSYDGPVEFGADSEANVSLHWAYGPDGPVDTIASQRIAPVPDLPFEFCLTGRLPDVTGGEFYVSAELLQSPGRWSVHDLINEVFTPVTPPAKNVVIEVSGLEACDAPNAGGFCAR